MSEPLTKGPRIPELPLALNVALRICFYHVYRGLRYTFR